MKEIEKHFQKSLSVIEFAKEKGWSEEELAKVINLLHSELKEVKSQHDTFYFLNNFPKNGNYPPSPKNLKRGISAYQ